MRSSRRCWSAGQAGTAGCRARDPAGPASCVYIRQPAPLGLGHAVLCARPVVGNEPFMVHLADDLIDVPGRLPEADGRRVCRYGGSVLGVGGGAAQGHRKLRHRGGRGAASRASAGCAHRREAQARQGAVESRGGRPLRAQRSIFEDLAKIGQGAGGEIQLTDGIARADAAARPSMPIVSRASATTAAASSATCRPRWSSASSTRSWAPISAPT